MCINVHSPFELISFFQHCVSITIVNIDAKVTFQNDKTIAYVVVGASCNNKIIERDMS